MYCSKCGSEQADAAKHCSQCGHALAVTSPQSEAYRAGQDVLSVALFRQRKASLLGITVSLLALCGAFAWLPQILEGRSSGCAALETRMVARLTTQQEVLGLLASGITAMSDGVMARTMVSQEYPNIPVGFACQLVYWGERTGMMTFKSPLADESTAANRRQPAVVTAPIEEISLLQQPTGRVNDFANIIDDATEAEIARELDGLEQDTSCEIAVATIPSLGGVSVEKYANACLTDGVSARRS